MRKAFLQLTVAAALLAMGVSPTAVAQSLKSLRFQEAQESALNAEADYTSRVCGGDIDVEIDWASARNWPEGESLADACSGALSALEAACRAGDAPDIEVFICTGDGSGPRLSRGELVYGASPGGDGFAETRDLLDEKR